jgi:hypothetical protein
MHLCFCNMLITCVSVLYTVCVTVLDDYFCTSWCCVDWLSAAIHLVLIVSYPH